MRKSGTSHFEETILPILQKWEFNAFATSESSLYEIPSEIISLISSKVLLVALKLKMLTEQNTWV